MRLQTYGMIRIDSILDVSRLTTDGVNTQQTQGSSNHHLTVLKLESIFMQMIFHAHAI